MVFVQLVLQTKRGVSPKRATVLTRNIEDNAIEPGGKRLTVLEEMTITIDL